MTACNNTNEELQTKVDSYAVVEVKSPLYDALSDNDKKIVALFREAADIMDGLFWKQTFGDKSLIEALPEGPEKAYALINYGAWDHLDNNAPFIKGYGEKPLGCQYYPQDMTAEEFEAFDDPNKLSLYTVIRRDENGALKTVWYRDEYKEELDKVCALMEQAIELTENEGLRNYLIERVKAFRTDDYLASDLAWMDMKDCNMDFIVGPIENYDDHLYEAKAAYESMYGEIRSGWKLDGDTLVWNFAIPANTTAHITLPQGWTITDGSANAKQKLSALFSGEVKATATAGEYELTLKK